MVQAVRPYFSPDDVTKGSRWSTEIAKELEASRVGLICLTPDNRDAPWVMFEAGALSRSLDRSKVCPILFGVEPTDVEGPLVQCQASSFSHDELQRVVRMINKKLGDQGLAADVLDSVLEMWWPRLEKQVAEISRCKGAARSERDILEEVLALSRSMARQASTEGIHPAAIPDLIVGYQRLKEFSSDAPPQLKEAVERLDGPIHHIARRVAFADQDPLVADASVRRFFRRRPTGTDMRTEEPPTKESK